MNQNLLAAARKDEIFLKKSLDSPFAAMRAGRSGQPVDNLTQAFEIKRKIARLMPGGNCRCDSLRIHRAADAGKPLD